MYGNIYPTKCMGKTTDTFGRLKLKETKLTFKAKPCAAGKASNIELLMLVWLYGEI